MALGGERRDRVEHAGLLLAAAAEVVDREVVAGREHRAQVVEVVREGVADRDQVRRHLLLREDAHLVAPDVVGAGVRGDRHAGRTSGARRPAQDRLLYLADARRAVVRHFDHAGARRGALRALLDLAREDRGGLVGVGAAAAVPARPEHARDLQPEARRDDDVDARAPRRLGDQLHVAPEVGRRHVDDRAHPGVGRVLQLQRDVLDRGLAVVEPRVLVLQPRRVDEEVLVGERDPELIVLDPPGRRLHLRHALRLPLPPASRMADPTR